ncbi:hypothetical protein Tco_0961815 [Tanacetum coccineum]
MSMWITSRGVVLLILLMEYKFQVLEYELSSLSDHTICYRFEFGKLASDVKVGCNQTSHRQERLEYMDVHDNDASESSQPSWGEMCTSGT